MATAGEYILVVVNGISIVLTVVGGLLTIITICTRPSLRRLVNAPLVSLSSADILFAILCTPFWMQQILNPHWEPPAALCWLIGYASPVLWGVSVSHMLCIALQRYFKICTNSLRLKSRRTLVIMLLLTWLVPIVSFLPLYVGEEVKVDPKLKRCAMGRSGKLWAKIPPVVLNFIVSYIAALACYILIQNHVRKSKKRVRDNTQPGVSNQMAVQNLPREGSSGVKPSTSYEMFTVTKSLGTMAGVEWAGDRNSLSSDDGDEQKGNGLIESGKHKGTMILVQAAGTNKQEKAEQSLPSLSDVERPHVHNEPDVKQKYAIPSSPISVSDHAGTNKRRQLAFPGSRSPNCPSAAERQLTKMMMTLFAVYTLCCMPMTLMVIFSSKVPAEAFTVGQLLATLNGVFNPIVYGVMNKNIRQGYKYIWDRMLNFIT